MGTDSMPEGSVTLGRVRVGDTGFSVACGWDDAVRAIKEKARQVGADAAYIESVREPDIWSTCYGVSAFLIAFPGPKRSEPYAIPGPDADEGAVWARARPGMGEVVRIGLADWNPPPDIDAFAKVSKAVLRLEGANATGTAFILTRDGLALTNHHVVAQPALRVWRAARSRMIHPARRCASGAQPGRG